jgi:hypothetical protein
LKRLPFQTQLEGNFSGKGHESHKLDPVAHDLTLDERGNGQKTLSVAHFDESRKPLFNAPEPEFNRFALECTYPATREAFGKLAPFCCPTDVKPRERHFFFVGE